MRLILLLSLLITSCNSYYKPLSYNIPLHEKTGDISIAAYYGTQGISGQLSSAFSNNLYVSTNASLLKNRNKEDSLSTFRSFDVGLGFFKWLDFKETLKLDIALGYGPGDQNYYQLYNTIPLRVRYHLSSKFHRYYLQPSLGYSSNKTDFAISMRASVFQYYNIVDHYNPKFPQKSILGFLEPVFMIRKGIKNVKFSFQSGISWPLTPYFQMSSPTLNFFANAGIHINFNFKGN